MVVKLGEAPSSKKEEEAPSSKKGIGPETLGLTKYPFLGII